MYDDRHRLFGSGGDLTNLVVGAAAAGVVGYLSIGWLLGFLKRYSTYGFVAYRLVLAAAVTALWLTGTIR